MRARRHASNDVESSCASIKKHPMKDVEVFIEFIMERRLDKDKPDPKAKSELKSEPTQKSKPEPGAGRRSGRDRQPVALQLSVEFSSF